MRLWLSIALFVTFKMEVDNLSPPIRHWIILTLQTLFLNYCWTYSIAKVIKFLLVVKGNETAESMIIGRDSEIQELEAAF